MENVDVGSISTKREELALGHLHLGNVDVKEADGVA